jgi:endo-1,4-beta-mannosidase
MNNRLLFPQQPATQQPFALGVNYWPRRKAMNWWKQFEPTEVQEEFAVIAELGLQVVRIFLLWEDFQPTPERVSTKALEDLETVADIAVSCGLRLDVTFFTGHMSGPNWCPEWLLSPGAKPEKLFMDVVSGGQVVNQGYRNPYTDPQALEAERLLLRTVVERLKHHAGVAIWNLGNEPDLFACPPTAQIGREWVATMTDLIRSIDPVRPVTTGLHVASLVQDNGLQVQDVFEKADLATMHGYPMYSTWARDKLDPWFVPFTCALTHALSGKPTLAEEFGACTAAPGKPSETWTFTRFGQQKTQFMAGEQAFADHLELVLHNLVEVGSLGAMLWCFSDYVPELWNQPPCDQSIHERFFGLVRPDGSLKPHAKVMQRFAAQSPMVVSAPRKTVQLDLSPQTFYQDPRGHAERLYQRFCLEYGL